ncbi:MAG: hypothetical protein HKP58_10610 [Desulfatitalea sp.]|nr:hypothetical protein [Desulfatitalea sp.]NNK00851.1 hypothetical protein [Desulfatitalea sp.]
MLNITIPMWLLLTVAGLPNLCLVLLVLRMMRLRRRKKPALASHTPSDLHPGVDGFGRHIHREILSQQIDTVFTALYTIIESEHMKLTALVNQTRRSVDFAERGGRTIASPQTTSPHPTRDDAPMDTATEPTIISLAEEGLSADDIADVLQLSRAEVALALKVKAAREGRVGRQVRAVA